MPPGTRRAFGFETSLNRDAVKDAHGVNVARAKRALDPPQTRENASRTTASMTKIDDPSQLTENGKPVRLYRGLGSEIGLVELSDGTTVDGGRLLMRDTWNASLPPSLLGTYQSGASLNQIPDVWIHKNRMSGLWGASTPATDFFGKEGIRTLLFAGVNTDQCVSGSLQDAYSKGFDCVLLKDACGTTSPNFAQECIEYNSAKTWGFVTDCEALEAGIANMKDKSKLEQA